MSFTIDGAERMKKYGSFVKSLAECWFKADWRNKEKLEKTFNYFEYYEKDAQYSKKHGDKK